MEYSRGYRGGYKSGKNRGGDGRGGVYRGGAYRGGVNRGGVNRGYARGAVRGRHHQQAYSQPQHSWNVSSVASATNYAAARPLSPKKELPCVSSTSEEVVEREMINSLEIRARQRASELLKFATDIQRDSVKWRIGARSALQIEDVPNAEGLKARLDIAERQGALALANIVGKALLNRAQSILEEPMKMRNALNAKAAESAAATPATSTPATPMPTASTPIASSPATTSSATSMPTASTPAIPTEPQQFYALLKALSADNKID
uniref:Uncharacterized protein n=1 Tax=Plectus sambesii TaxID=2011161 RepID=A0A914WST0_9BILA